MRDWIPIGCGNIIQSTIISAWTPATIAFRYNVQGEAHGLFDFRVMLIFSSSSSSDLATVSLSGVVM